ncbi:hypothetical protein [Spirulina sp. 06S082]|uniref:hypothetical protein n=1 Tax=Spirulina sp. 06S082 TaxID=3110248 RepID=UPI002B1F1D2F|nr:hypothetical protein [Spirulina sp. 06S082]MEA5472199.1 hypothetical protein [Spirulina sp. 06S082]
MFLRENTIQIDLITCTTRPCQPSYQIKDPLVPDPLILLAMLGVFGLTALFSRKKIC